MFGLLPSAFFAVVLLIEAAGAEARTTFWLLTLGAPVGAAILGGLTYWLLLTGYELVVPNLMVRVKQPQRFSPLSVLSSKIALFVGLVCFAGILAMGVLENLSGVENRLLNTVLILKGLGMYKRIGEEVQTVVDEIKKQGEYFLRKSN